MFDPKTIIELEAYVYMLIRPNENNPFYIGKGRGNRVFDHMNCALKDIDEDSAKYDIIRQINKSGNSVNHIIVRHGLTDSEAFHVEASLIDSYIFSDLILTNKQSGHNSIEKGLMTSDEIINIYNATPLNHIPKNAMIININRTFPKKKLIDKDKLAEEIYKATKGIWALDKRRIIGKQNEILRKYVLSEYRGLIVEVFEVEEWFSQERGYGKKSKKYGEKREGSSFKGKVADDSIRILYINKSISHHKKRGAASSHRYSL